MIMPVAGARSMLSGMRVREAMRRQIVAVTLDKTARDGIGRMIKYKSDILLITGDDGEALGVVSKTDLIGAFYAGLPVDTPLEALLVAPLLFCFSDDALEDALEIMIDGGVHQLFVKGADAGRFEGMLAYGDILGLVYRYCHRCRNSRFNVGQDDAAGDVPTEIRVFEVMTAEVIGCSADDDLAHVIEILSRQRMGAVLVSDGNGRPAGVISKSDLMLAWHRDVDIQSPAASIMHCPIRTVHSQATLTNAMMHMLIEDIGRLFVRDPNSGSIIGVISLSDAANHRSGTCRACVSSRMLGKTG
jgi:CBS domain-containing protein